LLLAVMVLFATGCVCAQQAMTEAADAAVEEKGREQTTLTNLCMHGGGGVAERVAGGGKDEKAGLLVSAVLPCAAPLRSMRKSHESV
jgi:hypothetical protein